MEENEGLMDEEPRRASSRLDLEAFNNPWVQRGAIFAVGLFIGLIVLGWWLFPVQWTDAEPAHLRADLREDYLRMVIDSYNLREDFDLATARLDGLGDIATEALDAVAATAQEESLATIALFRAYLSSAADEAQPTAETAEPTEATEEDEGGLSRTQTILLVACAVTLVLGGALVALFFWRNRRRPPSTAAPTAAMRAHDISQQAEQTDFAAEGESPPLNQWITTYLIGDDLYDVSFPIDSPGGEFIGECGVGIADTIGVGAPKRVSSVEVWLFDKNDIETETKVLMTDHAYNDEATRERLDKKGELILAQPNSEFVLETETLQMVVRVVDVSYGEGPLPERSFFDRLTLELAVWSKVD